MICECRDWLGRNFWNKDKVIFQQPGFPRTEAVPKLSMPSGFEDDSNKNESFWKKYRGKIIPLTVAVLSATSVSVGLYFVLRKYVMPSMNSNSHGLSFSTEQSA